MSARTTDSSLLTESNHPGFVEDNGRGLVRNPMEGKMLRELIPALRKQKREFVARRDQRGLLGERSGPIYQQSGKRLGR